MERSRELCAVCTDIAMTMAYIKSICVHSHRLWDSHTYWAHKLIDFMQTMGRSVGEKLPKTLFEWWIGI